MKQCIDINSDVGEGVGNEAQLMPLIASCNIACGGHAGDLNGMKAIVRLAKQHDVKIGAHPSFPDKEHFGRKIMTMHATELYASLCHQIKGLQSVLESENAVLHHIKPHGALYNLIAKDEASATIVVEVLKSLNEPVKLYAPYNSVIAKMAIAEYIEVVYEAFADRNYNEDLSLVSRQNPKALITNKNDVYAHVKLMFLHKKVKAISGVEVPIKASTYCIHSDTENAVDIAQYLASKLERDNIIIQ